MIRLDPKAMDFAKSGLFAALGSATDENGNKIKVEIDDDILTEVAQMAVDNLVLAAFGPDVQVKKDSA